MYKNLPSPRNITEFQTGRHRIQCSAQTGKGTLTDAHLGTVEIILTGCSEGSLHCQSVGAESGEIKAPLTFHLGLEHNSTSTEVPALLLLLPEVAGKHELKLECLDAPVVITGNVIGLLVTLAGGPVATAIKLTSFCLTLTQTGGVQNSKEFLLSLVGGGTGSLMTDQHLEWSVTGGAVEELGLESGDLSKNSKTPLKNQ
jgi:hypothetical protein